MIIQLRAYLPSLLHRHDENEGKMVIVNQQTKELDIYVSVTRSRWASQMRNKTLAAPSNSAASDSDMCPVCHQTVVHPAHDHSPSDELVLAVPPVRRSDLLQLRAVSLRA